MADIESKIKVDIDTSQALSNIKFLQQQISAFQQAMAKAGSANAALAQQMQKNLVDSINGTGKFQANIQGIQTVSERFTSSLEKNKFSIGEYFRYAGGATKSFGKLFKTEFQTIDTVARERVKDLQTQYIKLGRDASGAMQAIKVRPLTLDMQNLATQTMMSAQKQQLLNQLLKQGSTAMLNWGKNTQWAGRQLMVGFTIPLTMMGSAAAKAYMDIEKASIQIKRVYGDMNTTSTETDKVVKSIRALANEYTKYGVAVADTMDMAAKAAAMGKTGADLLAQVNEASKLSVLGQVDQQQALETTISMTNAFGTATEELAGKIDFLNAVENQTVTSIDDLTVAIPKAAPVIRQLGGDVEDLAFFLTAMREGGINASEGANALKSGLASMINPTRQASNFLAGFGINVKKIVEGNSGNVKQTVIDMAKAFDTLDPLNRARAIEQMFGKFQFSRISTLFQNVIAEGSQATKVSELAVQTAEELAVLSEREMKKVSDSPMYKFQKSIQDIQAKLAPVGEAFLKAITPIIEFVGGLLDRFNNLGDGMKSFVTMVTVGVAGLGPVLLMAFGLIANGAANLIKMFASIKSFFNKRNNPSQFLGEQTSYMNSEQIEAAAITASLDSAHAKLTQRFTAEASAVQKLTEQYRLAVEQQRKFAGVPGVPAYTTTGPLEGPAPKKYSTGVVTVPGPKGAGDIVPAMLMPGEAVIPTKMASKYAPLIHGMINDDLPGFAGGVFLGMPQSKKQHEGKLRTDAQLDEISKEFYAGPYAKMAPTNFGQQLIPTSGHSFPAFGVGGVYQKPDGTKVFVKPVIDLVSALAEQRGTEIARSAHGLHSPTQTIRVMIDPTDTSGHRRFLALESPVDERLANPGESFTKSDYFKQLVASLLRGDKDLGKGNLGGSVLADVGTAGVFTRASGKRELTTNIPSMEEQAIVNLLGVKGGAKRFFAEATRDIAASMTPEEYATGMRTEIAQVLPKLRATIAGFGELNPVEKAAYEAMLARLEAGAGVDWSRYQGVHAAVVPQVKKAPVAKMAGGYLGAARRVASNAEMGAGARAYKVSQGLCVVPGCENKCGPNSEWCLEHGPSSLRGKKKAAIFDVDDTLINLSEFMTGHRERNKDKPKEERFKWHEEAIGQAKPMENTIARLRQHQAAGEQIIIMTARPAAYEQHTIAGLQAAGIDTTGFRFISRPDKNYMKPWEMKHSMTQELQKEYDISGFYDDMDETRAAVSLLGVNTQNPLKMAMGGVVEVPGPKGAGDIIPALLSPGEAVIPSKYAKKYGKLINGMVAGNLPGYESGKGVQDSHAQKELDPANPEVMKQLQRVIPGITLDVAKKWLQVLGNFTMVAPSELNQALRVQGGKGGLPPGTFLAAYNNVKGKLDPTARYAGVDLSNAESAAAVRRIEDLIGVRAANLGKKTGKVDDLLLARAAGNVLDLARKGGSPAEKQIAEALNGRRYQVGSARMKREDSDIGYHEILMNGLRSNDFQFSPTGGQILLRGTEYPVGRKDKAPGKDRAQSNALYEQWWNKFKASGFNMALLSEMPIKWRGNSASPELFGTPDVTAYERSGYERKKGVVSHEVIDEKIFNQSRGALQNASNELAQVPIPTMQAALGIHSPSDEAAKKVGEPIAQGIAVGIDTGAADVALSAERAADGAINAALNVVVKRKKDPKLMSQAELIARENERFYPGIAPEDITSQDKSLRRQLQKRGVQFPYPEESQSSSFSASIRIPAKQKSQSEMIAESREKLYPGLTTITPQDKSLRRQMEKLQEQANEKQKKIEKSKMELYGTTGEVTEAMRWQRKAQEAQAKINKREIELQQERERIASENANQQGSNQGSNRQPRQSEEIVDTSVDREGNPIDLTQFDRNGEAIPDVKKDEQGNVIMDPNGDIFDLDGKRIPKPEEKGGKFKKFVGKAFKPTETTGRIGSAFMGLNTAVGMAAMVPGDTGKAAQAMLGPLTAASTAMSLIPGPAGLVAAGLIALGTGAMQLIASLKEVSDEAYRLQTAMGSGNDAIAKYAEFTKKATGTEAMNKRREQSAGQFFNVVPGKTTFGESYMKSDSGAQLLKDYSASVKANGLDQTKDMITNQLSTAIAAGVMTPAQARSVAANLAKAVGDSGMGLDISAKITDLVGPNGEDLKKDPLAVRMAITKASMEELNNEFAKAKEFGGAQNMAVSGVQTGYASIAGGLAGGLAGMGAVAASSALLSAGFVSATGTVAAIASLGSVLPGIGTAIGAIVGAGIMIYQVQEQSAKIAGRVSASIGNALEVQQQMADSLEIDFEKRIAIAKAAGDTAEATKLQNTFLEEQKKLLESNSDNISAMYDGVENMGTGFLGIGNTQRDTSIKGEDAIRNVFKDSPIEAETAISTINDMQANDGQRAMLKQFVAKKQLGFNQLETASQVFGDSQEGADQLESLMKIGGVEANRALGLAGGIKDEEARKKFLVDMSLADPQKAKELNDALEIVQKTTGPFGGDEKTQQAILRFGVENADEVLEMKKNIDGLRDLSDKKIVVAVQAGKLGSDVAAAVKKDITRFNKYNKANKLVYLTELQQIMKMSGDQDMINSFKLWRSEQGNPTLTFADYASFQADRTVQTQGVDNTGGTKKKKEAAAPEPSILDPYVEAIRNAINWQQRLTIGWNASLAALKKYSKEALQTMGGLAVLLQGYGADANFINAVLGGRPDEINKIIDRTTGKLTKTGKFLIAQAKMIEDAKLGMAYILMSPAERLAADNELWQAGLDSIATKEKDINAKYDARVKALDAIVKLNEKNRQFQQNELDLADALSRGDIAAAARAAMKIRQDQQKAALDQVKEDLDKQRQKEIENIQVTINGLTYTKAQLEKEIAINSEKIAGYKLLEAERQAKIRADSLASAKNVAKMLADGKALANLPKYNPGGGGGDDQGGDDDPKEVVDNSGNIGKVGYDSKGVAVANPYAAGAGYIGQSGGAIVWDFKNKSWTTVAKRDANANKEGYVQDEQTPGKWVSLSNSSQKVGTDQYKTKALAQKVADMTAAADKAVWKYNAQTNKGWWELAAMEQGVIENPKVGEQPTPNSGFGNNASSLTIDKDKYFRIPKGSWVYSVEASSNGKQFTIKYGAKQPVEDKYRDEVQHLQSTGRSIKAEAGLDTFHTGPIPYVKWDSAKGKYVDSGSSRSMPLLEFATGGYVSGPGTGTSDSIPAMLSDGEYVIRAKAAKSIGIDVLNRMNYADKNGISEGNSVNMPGMIPKFAKGGQAKGGFNWLGFAWDIIKDVTPIGAIERLATGKGDVLDVISLIPGVGKIASVVKVGMTAVKTFKAINTANKITKTASEAGKIAKTIDNISTKVVLPAIDKYKKAKKTIDAVKASDNPIVKNYNRYKDLRGKTYDKYDDIKGKYETVSGAYANNVTQGKVKGTSIVLPKKMPVAPSVSDLVSGKVKYFAQGGLAKGSDTIPSMLSPGEFVVKKSAVDRIGAGNLSNINSGSSTSVGDSVYNYSINVSAGSNASPDDIAKTVIAQIRGFDNQQIRGVRV